MAKRYYVRWFASNGYNYKDTSDANWKAVQRFKKLARLLGERIEYEEMD